MLKGFCHVLGERSGKSAFTGRESRPFLAVPVRYFVVVIGLVWSGGPAGNMAHVLLPRFNTEGQW